MRIERRYPKSASHLCGNRVPPDHGEIRKPDGSVVFHADNVECADTQYSQVAADVLAQSICP